MQNKVVLKVTNVNLQTGAHHVALMVDGKDCGILYLNEEQRKIVDRILKTGSVVLGEEVAYAFDYNGHTEYDDEDIDNLEKENKND